MLMAGDNVATGLMAILGTPAEDTTDAGPVQDEATELGVICGLLAELRAQLDPVVTGPATATTISVGAVHRLFGQLQVGLRHRQLSKPDAARLVHLIGHNLREATTQLDGEAAYARHKRARRHAEELRELVTGTEDMIAELRPRIMRLFDDADTTAPPIPVGHGPT